MAPAIGAARRLSAALEVGVGVADELRAVIPPEGMLDFDGDGREVIPFVTMVEAPVTVLVAALVAAMMIPPFVVATAAVEVGPELESEAAPESELADSVLLVDEEERNLLVVRTV